MARFDLTDEEWAIWTCHGLIPSLIDDYLLLRRQDYGTTIWRRLQARGGSAGAKQRAFAAAGSKRENWRKVLAAHAAVAQVRFIPV